MRCFETTGGRMRKFLGPIGSLSRISIESHTLKTNMLGDPSTRVVDVYLPAGHHGEGLPLLVDLVGFVVAFPDCFTRLGGNQYINSASVGAWEDFLLHEMLPEIERRFGCGGPGRRGVFTKSCRGYRAIQQALRHGYP